MHVSRQLLQWHQWKQKQNRLGEEILQLEQQERALEERIEQLRVREQSLLPAAVSSPEAEIEKLLVQQDIWMAEKERKEIRAKRDEKEAQRLSLDFDILTMEQTLPSFALDAYNRLATYKQNPVVEVRNQSCMGCFMPLSLRNLEEWRRGVSLVFCDECDRILV
jgi:predicted  nucleic acid-binding Zn-ribbon protein